MFFFQYSCMIVLGNPKKHKYSQQQVCTCALFHYFCSGLQCMPIKRYAPT